MTTSSQGRVKELFDLPDSVHKIGFVEELARAVRQPKVTAETYVVTPALVAAFHRCLDLVGGALRDGRSRAAFLQGSFGSGKSHFMALVSLLLDGDEHAWRIPELHVLREKHAFAGKAKLLQLRFHMIGHKGNLESAIFGRYLDVVRALHPGADLPGVFADEKLFEDARRMLDELGDERFFAPMNAGKESDTAWGTIGAADVWTRERFDAAVRSAEPSVREALFNALAKTRFGAFAEENDRFIDLDEGLAILGRHAKRLGYDAVVLFLDELILWLASRAADLSFFHNEVQKLVKLVEAQEVHRDVPFVSFIARQRDLADMVGREHEGLQNALVRDSLKWCEGRFDTIHLEDRNLPAIAEKRILRSKWISPTRSRSTPMCSSPARSSACSSRPPWAMRSTATRTRSSRRATASTPLPQEAHQEHGRGARYAVRRDRGLRGQERADRSRARGSHARVPPGARHRPRHRGQGLPARRRHAPAPGEHAAEEGAGSPRRR